MWVDTTNIGEEYSGEEDGDEREEAYISDSFLAEWNPHTTTSSLSVGIPQNPDPHGPPETTLAGCLERSCIRPFESFASGHFSHTSNSHHHSLVTDK
jgi:hypothetical protein